MKDWLILIFYFRSYSVGTRCDGMKRSVANLLPSPFRNPVICHYKRMSS